MSAMGIKIEQFDVPVCNSFQAKILNDQLCYEVDLSKFSNKGNIERELKLGFNFIMDYNEDRQIILDENITNEESESDKNNHAFIYLDTIGECQICK